MLEQRYQFIPLDKYASGVIPEELAERFVATIIGAVAPWLRLLGFFTDVQLNFELLGVAVGFLHSCLFKRHLDLLLQLVLICCSPCTPARRLHFPSLPRFRAG